MKWTRASEDNLPRPEDMPKCGRFLGPNNVWYYGTIQMVAEIISAARNKPLHKNRAMYTEWLDESPESSVWPGEQEIWAAAREEANKFEDKYRVRPDDFLKIFTSAVRWVQPRTAVKAEEIENLKSERDTALEVLKVIYATFPEVKEVIQKAKISLQ